jgi:hypothetical protein
MDASAALQPRGSEMAGRDWSVIVGIFGAALPFLASRFTLLLFRGYGFAKLKAKPFLAGALI